MEFIEILTRLTKYELYSPGVEHKCSENDTITERIVISTPFVCDISYIIIHILY